MVKTGKKRVLKPRELFVATCKGASQRTQHAANELSHYASGILAEKVPVAEFSEALKGKDVIVVGWPGNDAETTSMLKRAGICFPKAETGKEGFVIESFQCRGGNALLIAGRTDLGTLYGVYHYLESFCKVGFFWSTDHVPRLQRMPMEGISVVENPRFANRFMTSPGEYSFSEYWTWREWKRELEFRIRKKHNLIGLSLGADIVWKKVLSRHGVPSKPLSPADLFRDRLAKKVARYAQELGLRLVTPAFMGDVPAEFVAANPGVRYVEVKKWDWGEKGPSSEMGRYIHPSDPMFRILGEEFLRAYTARYGSDHLYFVPPYPEACAGSTPEERSMIKLDFAGAVQEYINAADPEGIWLADTWTFFTVDFWPLDDVKSFCLATAPERFGLYDTWGEQRPLYRINNYYYGRYWTLGILHCFGGNTILQGDLQGLIDSVQSVLKDPRANRCTGIHIVPEVMHHNDLYYDLAMSLSWNPEGLTLDEFLVDYAQRRYGQSSAPTMKLALNRLAKSVYGDKDIPQPLFLRRLFGGFDTPNTEHYVPLVHAAHAVEVGEALSLALQESRRQRTNTLYWRDLVDMARRYYGDVFNQWISRLYYAYDSGDREAFEQLRARIEECMDAVENVLWSWKAYQLEPVFARLRPTTAFDPVNERVTRDMLSLWDSRNLLDYVRRDDLAEIFTNYYRRRVKTYVDHLAGRLGTGQPGIDYDFLEAAYRETGKNWIDGPWDEPATEFRRNPVRAVETAFKNCRATADDLLPKGKEKFTNQRFEEGLRGWHVSRNRLDAWIEKHGGPRGSPALVFKGWTQTSVRYLTAWQDLTSSDDLELELDWKLKAFGPSSHAGLRVEVFDGKLCKKAEITYQFGDGRGHWPDRQRPDDATPEWTVGVDARLEWWTGFYTVKQHLGAQLNAWKHLTARPAEDLDRVHGQGTWERLEPALLRTSLIASSRLAEDPIEGAFSNLDLSRGA